MHEIVRRLDVDFILRSGTTDLPSVDWIAGSVFLEAARAAELTPSDVVLDLGAHVGSFALPLVKSRGCRAHLFEPDEPSLRLSHATALLNRLDHLTNFHEVGISGEDGTVRLYQSDQNWGHTIVEGGGPWNNLTGESSEIRVLSLASALDLAGAARRTFVKVNIEGAEFAMFDHANAETLRRADVYVGEIHFDLGRPEFDSCTAKLEAAGFVVEMVAAGDVRSLLVAKRR
jgi:FkbM family methyltransferase